MNCNCKDINSIFLRAIEKDIQHWGAPNSPEQVEMYEALEKLAKGCGFEKDANGHWTQFPKQEEVLVKIGPYTIVQEHDDGDLTLETNNFGKVVITTDGEVFYRKQIMGV